MESNKDMAKEAQTIINNYIKRKRMEKINREYRAYDMYNQQIKKSKRKKQEAHIKTLNYAIIMLSLVLLNLIIYAFVR